MKWSVVGLMLLGMFAAGSAAILTTSLRINRPGAVEAIAVPDPEVELILAAKSLPAMSVVNAQAIRTAMVPAEQAPPGHLRSAVNVVGKLLAVPVVEGQVFTEACFATEASGAHLASALANGMRAFSVSLTRSEAGLLYAGCVVDVLVSITKPSADGGPRGEAMSMTLLQGVEVLAIDDQTVVSKRDEDAPPGAPPGAPRAARDRLMVTLMVDSTQAKALQLAVKYGTISLALRNPLDAHTVEIDTTLLSELSDEYSRLLAALAPSRLAEAQIADSTAPSSPGSAGPSSGASAEAPPRSLSEKQAAEPAAMTRATLRDRIWRVIVNQNDEVKVYRFRQPVTGDTQAVAEEPVSAPGRWSWEGPMAATGGQESPAVEPAGNVEP